MQAKQSPDADPGVVRTSPMKPPTYAEAFGYVLQTPRSLDMLLEFFAPEDHPNALAVLAELYDLGAIVFKDGRYMLASKRSAS